MNDWLRPGVQGSAAAGGLSGDIGWWRDPVDDQCVPAVVAVTAVNCHLWGLGPRVVIGVADSIADSIAEPGWPERAWVEQQAVIAHRDDIVQAEAMLAMAARKRVPFKPDPVVQPSLSDAAPSGRYDAPDTPENVIGIQDQPPHPSRDLPGDPARGAAGRPAARRRTTGQAGRPAPRRTP